MSELFGFHWRDATSTEELCAKAGLRHYAASLFQSKVKTTSESDISRFAWSFIVEKFGGDFSKVASILKTNDAAIRAFLLLGKDYDAGELSREQCNEAAARISAVLTSRRSTPAVLDFSTAADAFTRTEMPTSQGRFASQGVLAALLKQHAAYSENSISPYTTIVGPSGIGKTYTMQQLAVRHGLYVVYNNLAPPRSGSFPRPVTIGFAPLQGNALMQDWIAYLERQLLVADCCKKVGITAPGLFHFLASNNDRVLSARVTFGTMIATGSQGEDASTRVCKGLLAVREVLETLRLNNVPCTQPNDSEPPAIVCFDEARALLDGVNDDAFHSLRQAAKMVAQKRQGSKCARGGVQGEAEEPKKVPFFMVLLDTTLKISNFTPPQHHDRSAKIANQRIFHPIYQIDSLDIFAPRDIPDPSGHAPAVRKLFSFGRPLWGAFLDASRSWESLLELALKKITVYHDRAVNSIAILSYRMNFYIASATMAKDLMASMLRCLVAISPDRNDLITTQPSEPILAFAAAKLLQDPATRLSCIRFWIRGLHAGAINPGDIGEQIASIVLLFAFDCVAFGSPADLSTPPRAVPLGDVVAALLGKHVRDDLCRSYAGTKTGHLLQDGAVFFNHFVRASAIPTLAVLENAYRRGAALFLPARFPGMDVALPIRATPGGPLALLLPQIKNRKGNTNTPGLRLSMAEDLDKAIDRLGLSTGLHAVVGLVMCLRTQGDAHFVSTTPDSRGKAAETAASKRPTRSSAKGKEKAPPSDGLSRDLMGIAFGLGPDVYACLKTPPSKKRKRAGRQASRSLDPGPTEGQAEMEEISRLLERLAESWPNAYAEEDTESTYAQRLLDPFFDLNNAVAPTSEDEEDD